MQEFLSFAASHGLSLASAVLDGKIQRVKPDGHNKATGWYVGYVNHSSSGKSYEVAWLGDWRRPGEKHQFKPNIALSKTDQSIIKKQMRETQKLLQQEIERLNEETAKEAAEAFATFSSLATSPYLTRKKIGGLFGARIFKENEHPVIAIPMVDIDGKMWGYQKILHDGEKWFLSGQRCKETFHLIGTIDKEKPLYLCEGYATGASIHMATKGAVACTFSAGNIPAVAGALRRKYQDIKIAICADNDRFTESGNAGVELAEKAAKAYECSVIVPAFKSESRGTDFNDLHVEEGIDAVKSQIFQAKEILPASYIPLGFDGNTHFFYSTIKADIVSLSRFGHTDLFNLMPKNHWENSFPPTKGSRSSADWDSAADYLINISNHVGAFDPRKVRGTGVWLDRQRVVVNTGKALTVDGKKTIMQQMDTRYVYIQTRNSMQEIAKNPLSCGEALRLIHIAMLFKWRNPLLGRYLMGWLALARCASALPIRPHMWCTANAGQGKSVFMERFVSPLLGGPGSRLKPQGASTEAGLRQSLKADSLPIVFDEFETTGRQSGDRISALVELMRQAWSANDAETLKGSAGGQAQHYTLAFSALVASIQVSLLNQADRSRFTILELKPHKSDIEHWASLDAALDTISPLDGERLFARSIANIKNILVSYKVFRRAITEITKDSREGDQYGMLLAGYFSLVSDEAATPETAANLMADIDYAPLEDDEKVMDERNLITALRTVKFELEEEMEQPSGGTRLTRRFLTIDQIIGDGIGRDSLAGYGIMMDTDDSYVYIACRHSELAKKLGNTRWYTDGSWTECLKRMAGAKKNHVHKFGKLSVRTTAIPWEEFFKSI